MANTRKEMAGMRIGLLTVYRFSHTNTAGRAVWELSCDCGNTVTRDQAEISKSIRLNKKSSCGCAHHKTTHGLTRSHKSLHMVYHAMKSRCSSHSNKDFQNYGGRGIKVCREWASDFSCFVRWAEASGYKKGLTIERVNVNEGYNPENCTWIDNKRQALNLRKTVRVEIDGVTMCVSDWAAKYDIHKNTIKSRLRLGWSPKDAVTKPVRQR